MQAEREAETTRRLEALIDLLKEDDEGGREPPAHAAALWSEAAVRAFFATGAEPVAVAQPGLPGGTRQQAPPGAAEKSASMAKAQGELTAAAYRSAALARGIPLRAHGLFPPGDRVLGAVASDASCRPFAKHLVSHSGALELADVSWPVGDDAARRGLDLRYFLRLEPNGAALGVGSRLVAAVRYADSAAIGAGFATSVHGGAIETAFDETTAELAKITLAPLATTISFDCAIKKPVPLHQSLKLECVIDSVASGGLRINVSGTLKDEAGVLLATAKAQLVDVGALNRATAAA